MEKRASRIEVTIIVVMFLPQLWVEAAYEAEPFRHSDCGVNGVVRVVCAVRLLQVLDGLTVGTFEARRAVVAERLRLSGCGHGQR